jgi:2-deoxy-D-gluconate 3-dehydrogenase
MNLFDLTGKKAIVTGAGGGLGKGLAEGLAQAGAEVVLIGRSDNIFSTVKELEEAGLLVHALKADLTADRQALQEIFDSSLKLLGGSLDILVNNAGIQRKHPAVEFPLDEWDDVIETNLTTVFRMSQMAGRVMMEKGKGKIINLASMCSFIGGTTVPAYSASKGGVAQLTKELSNEWFRKGICVNAIAPGFYDTIMNESILTNPVRSELFLGRIPAGRWGAPDDLKGAVIFLASAASDYVGGIILPVDGGHLAY